MCVHMALVKEKGLEWVGGEKFGRRKGRRLECELHTPFAYALEYTRARQHRSLNSPLLSKGKLEQDEHIILPLFQK